MSDEHRDDDREQAQGEQEHDREEGIRRGEGVDLNRRHVEPAKLRQVADPREDAFPLDTDNDGQRNDVDTDDDNDGLSDDEEEI